MAISVSEIRELRELTGAGMMDCKEALTECDGNVEKSVMFLRKKGLADIKKRAAKKASEGTIGYYIHAGGKIGVMVEVNCETDFVAKGDEFQSFAKNVAMHIAATNPQWISREDVPVNILDNEREFAQSNVKDKPPQIIQKIVEGKLIKFYKETCLLDQAFVKDSNITVSDLLGELASKIGEKLVIKRFSRFVTGE